MLSLLISSVIRYSVTLLAQLNKSEIQMFKTFCSCHLNFDHSDLGCILLPVP